MSIELEDTVEVTKIGLKRYVSSSEERIIKAARGSEIYQGESEHEFTNRRNEERMKNWKE